MVFQTKLWIGTERFQSVFKKIRSKSFRFVQFPNIVDTTKSFVLSLKNPGAILNVFVLEQKIQENTKSFSFVLLNFRIECIV